MPVVVFKLYFNLVSDLDGISCTPELPGYAWKSVTDVLKHSTRCEPRRRPLMIAASRRLLPTLITLNTFLTSQRQWPSIP